MAALPYIQLYVADYLADTMHLSTEEHGAYLLIIMNYWQTGKPVPKKRLASVARLSSDRWISVEESLNEMFNDTGTHWEHSRIEADLLMVKESQEQRSKAGRASAEARKCKKRTSEKRENKGLATVVEIPLNENPTNRDTEKIREETDKSKDKPLVDSQAKPTDAEIVFQCWRSVMNHDRSKLQDKIRKLINTTLKSGYSVGDLEQAIRGCSITPHNMGQNERNQRYDGLHIILKPENIDRFISADRKKSNPSEGFEQFFGQQDNGYINGEFTSDGR